MPLPDPASRIAAWQVRSGRHGLPWQNTRDPYRIWLSEIMLQQTQAATVIPYYERFLARFPDVHALADAPQDAVLQAWAGLGYYARARNLHRCAQVLRDTRGGRFPGSAVELTGLPGIGRSTAAAISAFAYGERVPILDGNVRRLLARHLALEGDLTSAKAMSTLWRHAQAWLDAAPDSLDMSAYTQGQMDLGATVCTRGQPDCARCPLAPDCAARQRGLQNLLPSPRPRRTQPRHHCWLLIAECEGRIWLQRRPAAGIWGGLWAPPTFHDHAALMASCDVLAGRGAPPENLAAIEHVFTHFRLLIQPARLRVEGPSPVLPAPAPDANSPARAEMAAGHTNPAVIPPDAGESSWVPVGTLKDLGMPTPIARLLLGLYGPQDK